MYRFYVTVWVYQGDGRPGDTPHSYESAHVRNATEINPTIAKLCNQCQQVGRAIAKIDVRYIGE